MAGELGVELIVLSTRGWGRLDATALGRASGAAARAAACPIVLVRLDAAPGPRSDQPGARAYRRVVVALDGSPGAERVLPRVEPLVRAFAAELLLVRATVPPPAGGVTISTRGEPVGEGATGISLALADQKEAERYLAEMADRLRRRGVRAVPVTRVGPADAVILDCARTREADLVAMVADEGAVSGRLDLGPVADALVRHAPCPVLVARVA
jgi:nucleotide-binding universal stress UspA family protein